jgi:DNA-directed RNA polymerase specialized sigma24 family protein
VSFTPDCRAEAVRLLPVAHRLALQLRDAGVPDALIAECLQIDPMTVQPLMSVAEAKLAALLARSRIG